MFTIKEFVKHDVTLTVYVVRILVGCDHQWPAYHLSFYRSSNEMSEADDDSFDVNSLSEDPPAPSRRWGLRRLSCRDAALRCVLFPIALLGTLTVTLLFTALGAVPMFIFGVLLISFYYCCTREPIPMRVLLRALFAGDSSDTRSGSGILPTHTKQDIEQGLIRRVYLERTSSAPAGAKDLMKYPKHKGEVYWETDGVDGDQLFIRFSKPLSGSKAADMDLPGPALNHSFLSPPEVNENISHVEDDDNSENMSAKVDRDIEEGSWNPSNEAKLRHADDTAEPVPTLESCSGDADEAKQDCKEQEANEEEVSDDEEKADIEGDEEEEDISKRSGASCDICLLDYSEGDVVAWSTNKKCRHAFHTDCLVDWITRKPTCPSCRQDYRIPSPSRSRSDRSAALAAGLEQW